MRKAERLCVDGPPSNKNGQATSGPAMLVQRGVYVDHQALPQTAFLPFAGRGGRGFRKSLTRCCAVVPQWIQHLVSIGNPHELGGFAASSWGPLIRRKFCPHRVVAAVDVQELARGEVQVLRKEHADRPANRGFVLEAPAQGRPLLPDLFKVLEA